LTRPGCCHILYVRAEAETPRKDTTIQQRDRNAGLDITLQDIADGVEDELVVIDSGYQVRFVNSAARSRFHKGVGSPIGRLCYEVFHERDRPCSAPL